MKFWYMLIQKPRAAEVEVSDKYMGTILTAIPMARDAMVLPTTN